MIKCTYCPETRPSLSRLVYHMDAAHGETMKAVLENRLGAAAEAITADPQSSPVRHTPCVCGLTLTLWSDNDEIVWTHEHPAPECRDAAPATGLPTKADRESLNEALARTGAGLAEAGREMAEMRAALDAVDARMAKLDGQLTDPATVRRATLNQVWDKLMDAGNLSGAALVRDMLRGEQP